MVAVKDKVVEYGFNEARFSMELAQNKNELHKKVMRLYLQLGLLSL